MADVKWIKIVTDIFDDEKILLIETLPDADSIIVIWFKLLCLAGKTNNSGVFIFNGIPYTDSMLSTIFRRKESTVKLALQTFEQFGMIEIFNNTITIPNWGKHQSLDKIEAKNQYMKDYMQEYREKQKALADGKANRKANSKSNRKANVSSLELELELELEEELELELEEELDLDKKEKVAHSHSEYGWVKLTDEQYERLKTELGESELTRCIEYVDQSAQSTGNKNKWKDWNLVIRKCSRDGWGKRRDVKAPKKSFAEIVAERSNK